MGRYSEAWGDRPHHGALVVLAVGADDFVYVEMPDNTSENSLGFDLIVRYKDVARKTWKTSAKYRQPRDDQRGEYVEPRIERDAERPAD